MVSGDAGIGDQRPFSAMRVKSGFVGQDAVRNGASFQEDHTLLPEHLRSYAFAGYFVVFFGVVVFAWLGSRHASVPRKRRVYIWSQVIVGVAMIGTMVLDLPFESIVFFVLVVAGMLYWNVLTLHYCENCEKRIGFRDAFCRFCGHRQTTSAAPGKEAGRATRGERHGPQGPRRLT